MNENQNHENSQYIQIQSNDRAIKNSILRSQRSKILSEKKTPTRQGQEKEIKISKKEKLFYYPIQEKADDSEPKDAHLFDIPAYLEDNDEDEDGDDSAFEDDEDDYDEDDFSEDDDDEDDNEYDNDDDSQEDELSQNSEGILKQRQKDYTDGQVIKYKNKKKKKKSKTRKNIKKNSVYSAQVKVDFNHQGNENNDRIRFPIYNMQQNQENSFKHFLKEQDLITKRELGQQKRIKGFNMDKNHWALPKINTMKVWGNTLMQYKEDNPWISMQTFITKNEVIRVVDNIIDAYQQQREILKINDENCQYQQVKPRLIGFKKKKFQTKEQLWQKNSPNTHISWTL
ncbi:hypothetical protein PPERSA_05703 [Pseudocohnilembus persalinus]|uniref:Uncharacterized protein n=1 Tax=Pseudocohnilembus persalinus TaxID=266149 RepID=A0A0V0QMP6_PSEPJ|nr:hypothetical protein PPERSA_05703 [Pseudocohnilembus persalinus]|eukprot:KRX03345.1 hypothetical protein PPERSA_05703 [Pseudocohnilembus persalinus]